MRWNSRTTHAPRWPLPWLEVVLPAYAVTLVVAYYRPDSLRLSLPDKWTESLLVSAAWILGATLGGVLALSGLFLACYLLYSPVYLARNLRRILDPTVWVDPRELRFYLYCFWLLCALVALAIWHWELALVAFTLLAGSAQLLWRLLL